MGTSAAKVAMQAWTASVGRVGSAGVDVFRTSVSLVSVVASSVLGVVVKSPPPLALTSDAWLARTIRLSLEARGAYIAIALAAQAARTLPSVDELRHLARVSDRRVWARVWREIEPLLARQTDGSFLDPWVETHRSTRSAVSQAFSALGRKSADARRQKHGTAQPTAMPVFERGPGPAGIEYSGPFERAPERDRSNDDPNESFEREPERDIAADRENGPVSGGAVPVRPVPSVPVPYGSGTEQVDQEDQGTSPTGTQNDVKPSVHVLTKLAHVVLDELDAGVLQITQADIPEELKRRAAKAGLLYDATAITKALEGADWQRSRQTPFDYAVRLIRHLAAAAGPQGLTPEVLRQSLYALAMERLPGAKFDDWRDEVIRIGWEEATWRSAPGRLTFDGGRIRVPEHRP